MSISLPSEALGVSITIFIYSILCLTLNCLLLCLLFNYGEKSKYVTVFSIFTALSTFASIIQQVHFAANWRIIKQAHYEVTVETVLRHGIAFGGSGEKWDLVLFYIQFYCYNVMTLNLLFWAISLYNCSSASDLVVYEKQYLNWAFFSKLISIVWPGIVIGLMQIQPLQHITILHILSSYATIFLSLTIGSVLLVLILFKYMKIRRLIVEYSNQEPWWGSNNLDDTADSETVGENYGKLSSFKIWNRKQSIYDKALVTRFTIGFVIMAVFEVIIIFLTLFRVKSNEIMVKSGQPDLSITGAIRESLLFIPGVSASLMAFLVFGTTKSRHEYRDLLLGCCSLQNRKPQYRDGRG